MEKIPTHGRLTVALIAQVVAVLFSFYTWVDPLEGGVATAMVGLITVAAWLIGRVRVPPFTWISTLVTFAIAVAIIAYVLSFLPVGVPEGSADAPEVRNALLAVLPYVWVYRVGAVAVIAGAAFYTVKIWDARKKQAA